MSSCAVQGFIPQKQVKRYRFIESRSLWNQSVQAKMGTKMYERNPRLRYIEVTGEPNEQGDLPIVVRDTELGLGVTGVSLIGLSMPMLLYLGYLVLKSFNTYIPSNDERWSYGLYGGALPFAVGIGLLSQPFIDTYDD